MPLYASTHAKERQREKAESKECHIRKFNMYLFQKLFSLIPESLYATFKCRMAFNDLFSGVYNAKFPILSTCVSISPRFQLFFYKPHST